MLTESTPNQTLGDPVTLAMAVVMDRIRHLSREDRQDLHELSKLAFLADSAEEEQSATSAMLEILEQGGGTLLPMQPLSEPDDSLQRWVGQVSNQLKSLRKKAGFTQMELAEKSGIPQSHISRLENGEHSPSHRTLQKLAKALGVPLAKLDPSS